MGITIFLLLIVLPISAFAESGYDAWLRYTPIADNIRTQYQNLPKIVVTLNPKQVIESAEEELSRGISGLFGIKLIQTKTFSNESAFILGTIDSIKPLISEKDLPKGLINDGFYVRTLDISGKSCILVTALNENGVLYGTFELLKKFASHQKIDNLNETQNPYSTIRYTNEWNNLDGSIERGFGGKSIFYANNNVVSNLSRANDYARLLASIGINGCAVNNVNANTRVIKPEFLPELKRLGDVFRRWGIRIVISVDFASPKLVGGLETYDPLDSHVIEFWNNKTQEIYSYVPDLAGYVLKADAEGRPGPAHYNRTAAEAANTIARALKPHNGVLFYRGFVYGYPLDWRNMTADRAKAAFDNFAKLDGKFDENAVVQVKYGPIDFQVREPASPLFGALKKTNLVIELEVTQEYTGQQRHTVFLCPMWKTILDFDMKVDNESTPVKSIVTGKQFNRPFGGFAGVVNVGLDENWMANDLSMANVYAFGRLAWNPNLSSQQIIDEWTRLTFSNDEKVVETVTKIQLDSHPVFENYTGPLGVGTLTDMVASKYGPGIEASEHNGWGQWHRADHYGIGMERSVSNGTQFIGQYNPLVAKLYESVDTCPDELLLFMHHVFYNHVLHSGLTVIQHIYDTHYSGVPSVRQFVKSWSQLKGKIDEQRFERVHKQLSYQWGHSFVWREAICQWFSNMSQINDTKGRVGHYEGRVESELMTLKGYEIVSVNPWETASGGKAVECNGKSNCSAETVFGGDSGVYDISIQFYDQNNGISHYKLFVASKQVSEWAADNILPVGGTHGGNRPNGDTSTRHSVFGIEIKKGDHILIDGIPDGGEHAVIDYIEILIHESD